MTSFKVFKVFLTLGLVAALIWYVDVDLVLVKVTSVDLTTGLTLFALLSFQLVMAGIRWFLILRGMGVNQTPARTLEIHTLSTLTNIFLVSSIGGMAVKVYLARRSGSPLAEAILSVGLDKAFAFGIISIFSLFGGIFLWLDDSGLIREALPTMFETVIFILALLAVFFLLFSSSLPELLAKRFGWLSDQMLTQRILLTNRPLICSVVAVGFFAQLAAFVAILVLCIHFNVTASKLQILAVIPIIMLVASLPISLGGWGVREAAMIVGLGYFGVASETALAVSLIYALFHILPAAFGGVVIAVVDFRFVWTKGSV